jgi:hypothetical protein
MEVLKSGKKLSKAEEDEFIKNLEPGQFLVNCTIKESAATSLFCNMDNQNKFRRWLVVLDESKHFDNLILAFVILNTVLLAVKDHSGKWKLYNDALNLTNDVLSVIFAIECLLKIMAHGLVIGKHTYLRNGWNILDLFLVLTSFNFENLKVMRIFRVLRPLRTIQRISDLRKLTEALFKSMSGVTNVALFVGFMIYLFGVIGLQLFSGKVYYTCRTTPAPLPNATSWEIADVGI